MRPRTAHQAKYTLPHLLGSIPEAPEIQTSILQTHRCGSNSVRFTGAPLYAVKSTMEWIMNLHSYS